MEPQEITVYDPRNEIVRKTRIRDLTDLDTGEIVRVEETKSIVYGSEPFFKMYAPGVDTLYEFAESASEKVLFFMIKNIKGRSGYVYKTAKDIAKETGIGRSSVFAALAKIQNMGIFVKCHPGVWMINPAYVSHVDDFKRAAMMNVFINYSKECKADG